LSKKKIGEKGTKAMYEVLKVVRALNLFIPGQLDLFNKMVKLVLLYRCKKWGYGNCKIIERVHLSRYKISTKVL
jgi:hypothetical protein